MVLLPAGLLTRDARADTFNIEIDYMVDSGIGGHSHRPSNLEIDAVVKMFACQGLSLLKTLSRLETAVSGVPAGI